jgi:hypothetical protein
MIEDNFYVYSTASQLLSSFFLDDFHSSWNQQYLDTKVALIESLLPASP